MPYYSATRQWMVREMGVVEADDISQARQMIDDEDDSVIPIADDDGDPEITPGSLQEASPEEVKIYKRRIR
jgi:hypothetical protein